MTDLLHTIPSFPTTPYTHLLPSLEKHCITTTDLLTLDALQIARRAQLPALDVRRLANAVVAALQNELGLHDGAALLEDGGKGSKPGHGGLRKTGRAVTDGWKTISTLDVRLDAALGGGIPTGYITEITGESGAGKTQFLLSLLLSTQLPPSHGGLSKQSLYISTEAALPTPRLHQLLSAHPTFSALSQAQKPSLDHVLSIQTPDLESQDHILRYQLPVAIRRHNIGLVVLDSVAANYRAEFDRPDAAGGGAAMAQRSAELMRLGQLLRDLARREDTAIVVANQVADRFVPLPFRPPSRPVSHGTPSSPLLPRTAMALPGTSSPSVASLTSSGSVAHELGLGAPAQGTSVLAGPMMLDHQQRWFTGWGDVPPSLHTHLPRQNLKTPSLGLVWTNQIACRIVLIKEPVYGSNVRRIGSKDIEDKGEAELLRWRRWMRVVFAPWVEGGTIGKGVEFEIVSVGVRGLSEQNLNDHN
ncbi:MAG: hypothetical protein M1827_003440 [Pycnora praestabilis]|nr:MAG: hypothetical protein M1827_003440 [Pycnora praestabilis]